MVVVVERRVVFMRRLVETGLCFYEFSAVVLPARVEPTTANRTGLSCQRRHGEKERVKSYMEFSCKRGVECRGQQCIVAARPAATSR